MAQVFGINKVVLLYSLIASATFQIGECHKSNPRIGNTETKVERKITIIVDDEETSSATNQSLLSKPASQFRIEVDESDQSGATKKNSNTKFFVDEKTKLIYIDKENESGYLIGEINSSVVNFSAPVSDRSVSHKDLLAGKSPEANQDGNTPTNYSVYLVSRYPEHIAILLDIEEIDFESIINCEYQELRFSIIGEISKQLLNQKEGSDMSGSEGEQVDPSTENEEVSSSASQPYVPPLPVSEAMALLLNSPLNKTILDNSGETNDFKTIDSTIDYLHDLTCLDMAFEDKKASMNISTVGAKEVSRHKRGRKFNRSRKLSKAPRSRKKHAEVQCPQESRTFKRLMASRLQEHFEWDDFKIVCGRTRQLVIPMRSLKISVYSDEFSQNSKFRLRYRFISDPSLLPAQDNDKYFCRNRNIIDLSLKCNGIDECGDASDESIKICGYPSTRTGDVTSTLNPLSTQADLNSSRSSTSKKRLTYVNGDILHCCQSSDWLSLMPHSQANQLNLQTLIGDSMNLFSGPVFAPTKNKLRDKTGHKRVKRIVGGGVARKGVWLGQASLQYELIEPLCHFCAGTLIHPQYVLTAGHCITKDGLSRGIKVVFGAHDLRQSSGNHIQVRYVDDAQIYPGVDVKHLNFDWENDMNNDIALLRLNAPVLVTAQVAPACLPPYNTPLAVNTTCRSIGWGQTHGSGSSNLLKHLPLKVVESSSCSKELFDQENDDGKNSTGKRKSAASRSLSMRGRKIGEFDTTGLDQYSDKTMVCVNNDLGHGICQGDSGGPLYCDRVSSNGERCTEIYGVASFIIQYATVGAMCAVENLPGIFGEVSSKTEWISSTMKMFEQSYRLKYS